jgi:hypothetical protein
MLSDPNKNVDLKQTDFILFVSYLTQIVLDWVNHNIKLGNFSDAECGIHHLNHILENIATKCEGNLLEDAICYLYTELSDIADNQDFVCSESRLETSKKVEKLKEIIHQAGKLMVTE